MKIQMLKIMAIMLIISLAILMNQHNDMGNFNTAEATITFVLNTGRATRAKTILDVEYIYNNQKTKARITRKWNGNDYYKKGDAIMIYINQNDENDVR